MWSDEEGDLWSGYFSQDHFLDPLFVKVEDRIGLSFGLQHRLKSLSNNVRLKKFHTLSQGLLN